MQKSPKLIGLLQALGLVLYVTLFANGLRIISAWFPNVDGQKSVLPIIAFLLTFITSALICSSIALAYPVSLYVHDKKKEAIQVVLWNIVFLLIALALGIAGFAAL